LGYLRHAVIALAAALAACSDAPDTIIANEAVPTPSAPGNVGAIAQNAKLVVAFGDSLYAGYQLPQDQGFAPELQRALIAQGIAADVRNAGVSGDTTAAGLARLNFTLDGYDRKPDLVVLGLGGNDMLRGLSPAETRKNMVAILDELRRRDIPAVLTGMIASPNMGADYARDFNAIFPELSAEYDAPLYPFFLDGVITNSALMLPDGIHPNEAGVDAVVAKVAPVVAGALRD
jgi:acyl-CoA thioesterase I